MEGAQNGWSIVSEVRNQSDECCYPFHLLLFLQFKAPVQEMVPATANVCLSTSNNLLKITPPCHFQRLVSLVVWILLSWQSIVVLTSSIIRELYKPVIAGFQLLAAQKFTEPSGSFSPKAKKDMVTWTPQCPSKKITLKNPSSFLLLLLQHLVISCISLFQVSWPQSVQPPLGPPNRLSAAKASSLPIHLCLSLPSRGGARILVESPHHMQTSDLARQVQIQVLLPIHWCNELEETET